MDLIHESMTSIFIFEPSSLSVPQSIQIFVFGIQIEVIVYVTILFFSEI